MHRIPGNNTKLLCALTLFLGFAAAAQAQYSTPVREVTNPVNTLTRGECTFTWGNGQSGSQYCGISMGEVNKRFILNTVTVHCEGGSGAKFAKARIDASFPPEGSDQSLLYIPLVKADEVGSSTYASSYDAVITGLMLETSPGLAGQKPLLTLSIYKDATGIGSCEAMFYGNVQPAK